MDYSGKESALHRAAQAERRDPNHQGALGRGGRISTILQSAQPSRIWISEAAIHQPWRCCTSAEPLQGGRDAGDGCAEQQLRGDAFAEGVQCGRLRAARALSQDTCRRW